MCAVGSLRLLLQFIFCGDDKFTIDDGYQPPITLFSKDRQLIAATFYKYVLTNIGKDVILYAFNLDVVYVVGVLYCGNLPWVF